MPVPHYGVLKARPVAGTRGHTHYHLRVVVGAVHYRVSVNVRSDETPSELRYCVVRPFAHPLCAALEALERGFTAVASRPGGMAIDFVRQPPFEPRSMRLLPADQPGPNNDLEDLIGGLVSRTIRDPHGLVYAFGSRWGPEPHVPDRVFGFTPGNGVHNVHMNQGNHPRFSGDDGIWQDGALVLHVESEWIGVFLAFQSQSARTDQRGHRLVPWR
jgi:uncharacterized protein YukJ